jgi:hypothetical protein
MAFIGAPSWRAIDEVAAPIENRHRDDLFVLRSAHAVQASASARAPALHDFVTLLATPMSAVIAVC